jgi:hypothetical protein
MLALRWLPMLALRWLPMLALRLLDCHRPKTSADELIRPPVSTHSLGIGRSDGS